MEELKSYFQENKEELRSQIRQLGISTVFDRVIQQAILLHLYLKNNSVSIVMSFEQTAVVKWQLFKQ